MPSSSGNKNNKKPATATVAEDEAYAQALQEEYRKDFLRRQAKKNKYNQARREQQQQQQQQHQASAPPEDLLSSPYVPSTATWAASASAAASRAPPAPPSYNMRRNQTVDDEEYARQLQAQLEQEATQEILYYSPAATTATNTAPYVDSNNVFSDPDVDDLAQQLQDEEYARRLQNQVLKEDNRRRRQSEQQKQQQKQQRPEQAPTSIYPRTRTSSHFLDERTNSSLSDEATARRIQQELQDAEFAQRLSVLEQQEAMAQQVQQQENAAAAARRTPRQNCMRRLVPLLICATAIAVVPLLFVFGVFNTSDIPIFDDITDWINGDPWSGNTTVLGGPSPGGDAYAWSNSGNGLTLDILNACSDDWQVFINEALANWDQGAPIDSLSFRTTRIDYETTCSDVTGKLKICNGNYGDTRWRGLNEVMLSPRQNTIISSTARLNEYYLSRESDAQKLYTACHELGHGFGLPHWDEDFFNRDLGNCMDYTQNPSRNSKPDESNFLYLAQLYGGRNVTADGTAASSASTSVASSVPPGNNRRRRRHLRNQQLGSSSNNDNSNQQSSRLLDTLPYNAKRRVLHASDHHEVHLLPKGDGSGIMILQQYLLALSS
jgi:chemotaxis protein histidine kinase CheA